MIMSYDIPNITKYIGTLNYIFYIRYITVSSWELRIHDLCIIYNDRYNLFKKRSYHKDVKVIYLNANVKLQISVNLIMFDARQYTIL